MADLNSGLIHRAWLELNIAFLQSTERAAGWWNEWKECSSNCRHPNVNIQIYTYIYIYIYIYTYTYIYVCVIRKICSYEILRVHTHVTCICLYLQCTLLCFDPQTHHTKIRKLSLNSLNGTNVNHIIWIQLHISSTPFPPVPRPSPACESPCRL